MRFLLVEDDANTRRVFLYSMAIAGTTEHAVEVAGSVEETLRKVRLAERLHGHYDAICLDLNLPDAVGVDTFRRIYEAAKPTPILVLSAQEDKHLALQLLREGAADYVQKSHDLWHTVILAKLEKIATEAQHASRAALDRRRAANEALVQMDIVQRITKSVPPGAGSEAAEALRQPMSELVRLVKDLADREREANMRVLAEHRSALESGQHEAKLAVEAAEKIARQSIVEAAEARAEVQRLRDLTPQNKRRLAGGVAGVVAAIVTIIEIIRALAEAFHR